MAPVPRDLLCGFGFSPNLFLDLPVRKQIFVTATRTFPRSFYRIGAALVEHFHNQVTMQTHGRMTIHPLRFCGFRHDSHYATSCSNRGPHPIFQTSTFAFAKTISYNCLQKRTCSRSYTDGEIYKKVVILGVCLKIVSEPDGHYSEFWSIRQLVIVRFRISKGRGGTGQ